MLVIVAYLCQYVPWMLVTRECFIYHYFASAEISILAITFALRVIKRRFACGKKVVIGYMAVAAVVFLFMFPILNGFFVPVKFMKILQIFMI